MKMNAGMGTYRSVSDPYVNPTLPLTFSRSNRDKERYLMAQRAGEDRAEQETTCVEAVCESNPNAVAKCGSVVALRESRARE